MITRNLFLLFLFLIFFIPFIFKKSVLENLTLPRGPGLGSNNNNSFKYIDSNEEAECYEKASRTPMRANCNPTEHNNYRKNSEEEKQKIYPELLVPEEEGCVLNPRFPVSENSKCSIPIEEEHALPISPGVEEEEEHISTRRQVMEEDEENKQTTIAVPEEEQRDVKYQDKKQQQIKRMAQKKNGMINQSSKSVHPVNINVRYNNNKPLSVNNYDDNSNTDISKYLFDNGFNANV